MIGLSLPNLSRHPTVLPNAVPLDGLPTSLPMRTRDKTILFAGRIVADKGADSFVSACAQSLPHLPGWRAVMIGADRFCTDSPETPFIADLRPKAERAGIVLKGYQPHAEVMAALGRAAIAVVPSRWQEPFGLAALEALAMGAALVCSRRGGLPEVAGEAAVYTDPDDISDLAHAIGGLARDVCRREALSKAGRQRARIFDLAVVAAKWNLLRKECLGL